MCGQLKIFMLLALSQVQINSSLSKSPPHSLVRDLIKQNKLIGLTIYRKAFNNLRIQVQYLKHFGDVQSIVSPFQGINSNFTRARPGLRLVLDEEIDPNGSSLLPGLFNEIEHDGSFWLVPYQDNFSDLNLDISSDLITYEYSSESPEEIILKEHYKISPDSDVVTLQYGLWSPGKGLQVSIDHKWKRRKNLKGHHFKIATAFAPPYVTKLERVEGTFERFIAEGMFIDVFNALKDVMNFTYSIYQSPDMEYGASMENGSWTGMVGMLARMEIDIAPTDFTVTMERSEVIDFCQPITQVYHSIFIKNPTGNYNYQAYFQPLNYMTWVLVFAFIVTTPLLLFFTAKHDNDINLDEFTLSKSFVFAAGVFTFARPWNVVPSSWVSRLVFVSMLVGGSFIFWHWEAMLISYLSSRIIVLPFHSLDGLVYKSSYNIMLLPGSSFMDSFKYSKMELWQQAWKTKLEPYLDLFPKTSLSLVEALMNDPKFSEYALYDNWFSISTYPEYLNCEIIALPSSYDFKPYAFGFQKDFPYLPLFNYFVALMNEKGSLKQILDKYEARPQVCPDYSGRPLGFDNCITAFLVLSAGALLAILLHSCEILARFASPNGFMRRCLNCLNKYGTMKHYKGSGNIIKSLEDQIGKLKYQLRLKDKIIRNLQSQTNIYNQ